MQDSISIPRFILITPNNVFLAITLMIQMIRSIYQSTEEMTGVDFVGVYLF